jgi:phosphoesterase RecJ-like protein
MKATRLIQRIIDEIRASETICVVGHIRPDGDCIGSQLGLAMALENQGKKVTCWNQDAMPRKLAFLDPDQLLQKPKRNSHFDCVIATDCATFVRLGSAGPARLHQYRSPPKQHPLRGHQLDQRAPAIHRRIDLSLAGMC